MYKQKKLFSILLLMLLVSPLLALSVPAQTGSLAVWENIAGGTLTSTWSETSAANWKGQNVSGSWEYNCTSTASYNWTYNNTIRGDRWFHTWEVTSNDAETGVGSTQQVNATRYYAMIYYLDFNGTGPECYLLYYRDGTIYYWNGTGDEWTDNQSNATDYSCDDEIDFYSGWVRAKALWNWNQDDGTTNCTARFKIWDPSGDEGRLWWIDTNFTRYVGDTTTSFYSGLLCDHSWDLDPTETDYRRIFFWNLSYDLYADVAPAYISYIGVPQVHAEDLIMDLIDMMGEDYWNLTQSFKTLINLWDLTSFYEINDYTKIESQNDTIYVFTVMTTEWQDWWEAYMGEPWDYDMVFPNNMLMFYIYCPIDGTAGGSTDYARVRFDFKNDGYTADDYTVIMKDSLYFWHGWTNVTGDESEWYGSGGDADVDDNSTWGYNFRGDDYAGYVSFLNWDLISNETDVNTPVNISISFYDNATSNFCSWQDWDELGDLVPYVATDNNTWRESAWNDTGTWGILEIEGGALDFDDPVDPHSISVQTDFITGTIIPMLVMFTVSGMLLAGGISRETLMAAFMAALIGVIIIGVISGL
jgi:hypothetical protein